MRALAATLLLLSTFVLVPGHAAASGPVRFLDVRVDLGAAGAAPIRGVVTLPTGYTGIYEVVTCDASVGEVTFGPGVATGLEPAPTVVACAQGTVVQIIDVLSHGPGTFLLAGAAAGSGTFHVEFWGTPTS